MSVATKQGRSRSAGSEKKHGNFNKKKSFCEALEEKYSFAEDFSCEGFVIVLSGRPRRSSEGDGLLHLRNVVLSHNRICKAGIPANGLGHLCPNVIDLDLSFNLFDSWEDVLTLASELPHLTFLNLSDNSLHRKNALETWSKSFPRLENLVLNRTQTNWTDVCKLARFLPALKELHLCGNGFRGVCSDGLEHLHLLECLRLNGNRLDSWDEIWKLHLLPNLKSLILSENPLADLYYRYCSQEDASTEGKQTESGSPKGESSMKVDGTTGGSDIVVSDLGTKSESVDELKDDSKAQTQRLDEEGEAMEEDVDGICADVISFLFNEALNAAERSPDDYPQMRLEEIGSRFRSSSGDSGLEASPDNSLNEGSFRTQRADEEKQTSTDSSPVADDVPCRCQGQPFASLRVLCLSQTDVNCWNRVANLNKFPTLENVKLKDVPVEPEVSADDKRKLMIASLPRMKLLNGSEVSITEREKAERHFVRYFLDKDEKPHHFDSLRDKHNDVTQLVDIDIGFGFKEWATLHFRLGGKVVLKHKIRVIEPIGKLRQFIRKKQLLDDRSFKMFHLPCGPGHVFDTPTGPELEELFLDSLPMSRFNFQDGDEILIDPSG